MDTAGEDHPLLFSNGGNKHRSINSPFHGRYYWATRAANWVPWQWSGQSDWCFIGCFLVLEQSGSPMNHQWFPAVRASWQLATLQNIRCHGIEQLGITFGLAPILVNVSGRLLNMQKLPFSFWERFGFHVSTFLTIIWEFRVSTRFPGILPSLQGVSRRI